MLTTNYTLVDPLRTSSNARTKFDLKTTTSEKIR